MSDIVDLIQSTVRLEQPIGGGQATLGTGFIVTAKDPDGSPRAILVTANHVFDRMPGDKTLVGFRVQEANGAWRYAPAEVRIRGADGEALWTKHPSQDVAAIELPPGVAASAIPLSELPGDKALETLRVKPGAEMMVLGYPQGFAANAAGFPILRAGRVASYPLSPADRYPTYMVDFNVFGGNSGGPVYVSVQGPNDAEPTVVVTGVLTQQILLNDQRLAMGNVTQADFITETISLMGAAEPAEVTRGTGVIPAPDQAPVAGSEMTARQRWAASWREFKADTAILVRRTWIVVRDWFLALITPEPKRT